MRDRVELTLRGKKVGFEKAIEMIEDMVVNLKVGHTADDEKKEHSTVSLDTADDKKTTLEHSIAGLVTRMTKTECVLEATREKIGALEDAIKALDKMPAEAMVQRKEGASCADVPRQEDRLQGGHQDDR